ncbi:hypothetical protein HWV62_4683 [Athelia sp. TMB]|nr:hypothetical protein HWV62_4683 [Athelia sp. TMB]
MHPATVSPLPPLATILASSPEPTSPLATALSVLFEPSPILLAQLVPQLAHAFAAESQPKPSSYAALIDTAITTITAWPAAQQAAFVAAHPRIGESAALSALSAQEQGGAAPTPPAVLARLAHLNACYEATYPGLRYVTFVAGRPRAAIAEELEDVLGVAHSLGTEPLLSTCVPEPVEGPKWQAELKRAVVDVGRIAKARLGALGLQ